MMRPGLAWLAAGAVLLVYEAWALRTGHETLSRCVWDCDRLTPAPAFLAGFLMGHLFGVTAAEVAHDNG